MLVCILVCVPLFVCVVLSKGVCVPAMHVYELSALQQRSGQRRLCVVHNSGSKAQRQWQNS